MAHQTFTVLFLTRKARICKSGEVPIQMRITVNSRFVEMNTQLRILPAHWSQQKERATGKSPMCAEINSYLDALKAKICDIHKEFLSAGIQITPTVIKERLLRKTEGCKMFFALFEEHNAQMEKLLDINFKKSTLGRYKTCLAYFREMYRKEFSKAEDFPIATMNSDMIQKFEVFLRAEKRLANNTMIRFMKCVKKIVNHALANGWMQLNPFASIRYRTEEVKTTSIELDELSALYHKEIAIPRLAIIRDIYVFCSFTGLAFIDVKTLKSEHIIKKPDGKWWIFKERVKTGVPFDVMLLDIPLEILQKYSDHPQCIANGVVLPIPSNQKMNGYLKELADICGIQKRLTTHTARHTFASLTLANGASLENVSKMLGHTNLKMTQHYARVKDESIARNMKKVQEAFSLAM